MKTSRWVLWVLVLVGVIGVASVALAGDLAEGPWCGYWAFTRPSELPLGDLSTYTNVVIMQHDPVAGVPSAADLQALRSAGMGLILKLDPEMVEGAFDEPGLQALKAQLDPYPDVVVAIFPVDEPFKPGRRPLYTEKELGMLVQQVRDVFVGYDMFVNFWNPWQAQVWMGYWPDIPENIDILSADIAIRWTWEWRYKREVGRSLALLKDKARGRPTFFISRGHQLVTHGAPLTMDQLQWDAEVARDYKIDGLVWDFYDDMNPDHTAYGSSHFAWVIDVQRKIGLGIIGDPLPPVPGLGR